MASRQQSTRKDEKQSSLNTTGFAKQPGQPQEADVETATTIPQIMNSKVAE